MMKTRNNVKEDERKKKYEERLKKEDELYEWMAKLNVADQWKIKKEISARFSDGLRRIFCSENILKTNFKAK